ncbi:UNVERIFIED_CONTAM: hypothetical protein K2H54_007037 [Gekko kuhli]
MATFGHNCSANEYRSKTKAMRLHTLVHNSTSGNDRATCPYFKEVDRILQGDGSVRSRRVCNSFPLETRPSTSSSQETAESQSASPEEEFQLTLEPDEEEPVPEVLVLDTVELTQEERMDPEDDNKTMVEEPEPGI